MSTLVFVLFLLFLLGEILFFVRMLKFPVHIAPFAAILMDAIFLSIFGMLGAFSVGYYFVLIVGIFMGLAGIITYIAGREEIKPFLPVALFFLCVLGIYMFTRGTVFRFTEEFTTWGAVYRFLSLTNTFPGDLNNLAQPYSPITPAWQGFVSSIIGFSEENAYFAHITALFAGVFALIPLKSWGDWWKYLLALAAAFLSVFVLGFSFQNISVDLFAALLLAVGFAQIDLRGKYTLANLLLTLLIAVALVLTIPLGFVLAIIVLIFNGFFLVRTLSAEVHNGGRSVAGAILLGVLSVLLLVGLPALARSGWQGFSRNLELFQIRFSFAESPANLAEAFPVDSGAYIESLKQLDQVQRLATGVLHVPEIKTVSLQDVFRSFTINAPFRTKSIASAFGSSFANTKFVNTKFTLQWVLIAILALAAINQIIMQRNMLEHRKMNLAANGLLLLGFVIYVAAVYLRYVFASYASEGLSAPDLLNTLGIYLLAWWLFNLAVACDLSISVGIPSKANAAFRVMGIFVIAVLMFYPMSSYLHAAPLPQPDRFVAENVYDAIRNAGLKATDKVFDIYPVMPAAGGYQHVVMSYLLTPVGSNSERWYFGSENAKNGTPKIDLAPQVWLNIMHQMGYTYVLVHESDAAFWNTYGSLFDRHLEDLTQVQLFKVTQDNLEYIPLLIPRTTTAAGAAQ